MNTDEQFALFWSLYPRRVSRRAARKAWDKEVKSGTSPETIINGLRRQLAQFQGRDSQFIPHASTWINQGRFDDEIEPVRNTNGRRTIADVARDFNARFDNFDASFGVPSIGRH